MHSTLKRRRTQRMMRVGGGVRLSPLLSRKFPTASSGTLGYAPGAKIHYVYQCLSGRSLGMKSPHPHLWRTMASRARETVGSWRPLAKFGMEQRLIDLDRRLSSFERGHIRQVKPATRTTSGDQPRNSCRSVPITANGVRVPNSPPVPRATPRINAAFSSAAPPSITQTSFLAHFASTRTGRTCRLNRHRQASTPARKPTQTSPISEQT